LAAGASPAARLVGAGASIGLSSAPSLVFLEAADESRAEAILEEKIKQAKVRDAINLAVPWRPLRPVYDMLYIYIQPLYVT
jgi:hypothetical protein